MMPMKKIFTDEEKYAYVYESTNEAITLEISTEMNISSSLYEEMMFLKSIKENIDNASLCPKISTLKNILAYSYHTKK
jgi:hypothetical protein